MSVFQCVVNYFSKHKLMFVLSIIVIISVTLLSLLPPQLIRIIVDDIILENESNQKLLLFASLYMLTFVAIGIIGFLKEILLIVISQGITKNVRIKMLNKVHNLSYVNFIKFDIGDLEAYFSNDVEEINTLITSGVISMLIDGLKIIGIIVSIFIFSYVFGIITLFIIPLICFITIKIRKKMYNAQYENRKLEGKVNNLLLENVENIITIKSFKAYKQVENKFDDVVNNNFKTKQKANFYDAIFPAMMQMIKTFLIALTIILATSFKSVMGFKIGVLISSIDLITDLFKPIESLGMELQTIQKSFAAIDRINDFFKLDEDDIKSKKISLNTSKYVLEFKDVTFAYEEGKEVIKDFNLKLENNDRLTLKGRSGSGKSTIFKLAYGLLKPSSGHVLLNGVDTYLLDNDTKNKVFGIVYQDYYFSNGTIKDELTLLNDDISDEKVYQILNLVGLDRIKDIHKKLLINDYSTGELSLFNIARAIINDNKILFLDEMNAKIDSISAKKIIEVVDKVSKDKIVLSINHYGELLSSSKILSLNN